MKRDFIYIIIIIALSLFFFRSCEKQNKSEKNWNNNIEAMNDTVAYYKNSLGMEVAQKRTLLGEKHELFKIINEKEGENSQLRIALKNFKKPSTAAKIITETKIDTVQIVLTDSIPCNFKEIPFEKSSEYYAINGRVNNKKIFLDSIFIPNEQSVIIGRKKIGWFKSEYRVEVVNSNPLIKVKDVDAYDFSPTKKRWGIGVIGGYGFGHDFKLQPFVGVGVTYNLFQF